MMCPRLTRCEAKISKMGAEILTIILQKDFSDSVILRPTNITHHARIQFFFQGRGVVLFARRVLSLFSVILQCLIFQRGGGSEPRLLLLGD